MGTIREPRHELAELLAKREIADELTAIVEAIDEIDALRAEARRLRKEILEARQAGRPPEGYWLKSPGQ
jgi:hypothetical protein